MIFGSASIFEEEFWAIQKALNELLENINAVTVLLIDRAGQLVTSAGNTAGIDLSSFCTLSAADFAATNHLASLIGEEEFATVFHQGDQESIYMSVVDKRVILAVIFDYKSTLGLVRIRVKQTVEQVSEAFNQIFRQIEEQPRMPIIDESFAKEAEDKLDKLLG